MLDFPLNAYINGDEDRCEWHAEPEFDATNAHEAGRMPRLYMAWGHIQVTVSLLSSRYRNAFAGSVVKLLDHKGCLEVTWRDAQSRQLFEGVVMGAWERVGEHEGLHTIEKKSAAQ